MNTNVYRRLDARRLISDWLAPQMRFRPSWIAETPDAADHSRDTAETEMRKALVLPRRF